MSTESVTTTQKAGYCLSATAQRDGMELIAVVLHGSTSQQRFEDAKTMLNYGFSTYALHTVEVVDPLPALPVQLGAEDSVELQLPTSGRQVLLPKSQISTLTQEVALPESVDAPVGTQQQLGTLKFREFRCLQLKQLPHTGKSRNRHTVPHT